METTEFRYDPTRDRLNKIQTWIIMGHLSFQRPVPEPTRIRIFTTAMNQIARRIKMDFADLRWALKQEGDYLHKLVHFHFLLDGSNMPNKTPAILAANFVKRWNKAGGGNADVRPYQVETDYAGYQKGVGYLTKIEPGTVPYSDYFDAGIECQMKFSPGLDRYLAEVCTAENT